MALEFVFCLITHNHSLISFCFFLLSFLTLRPFTTSVLLTLHYTTLHYTTLHYTTLHYTTLRL